LTAEDVKTFFDWLEDTHDKSIKAVSAMKDYWRLLKNLCLAETGQAMDESMRLDCLNVGILAAPSMANRQ